MRATHLNKLVIYESLLITSTSHTALMLARNLDFLMWKNAEEW